MHQHRRTPDVRIKRPRALTGSQESGDAAVRSTLEAVIQDPQLVSRPGHERVDLYRVFHVIWQASEAFHQLALSKMIAEEVAQLTEARELRIWHDQIQYKPAGKGGAIRRLTAAMTQSQNGRNLLGVTRPYQ